MRRLFQQFAQEFEAAQGDGGDDGDGGGGGDDSDGDSSTASDSVVAATVLSKAMAALDTEFLKIATAKNLADGTTAVVALTHGDQLVVGNIGECYCLTGFVVIIMVAVLKLPLAGVLACACVSDDARTVHWSVSCSGPQTLVCPVLHVCVCTSQVTRGQFL